MTTGPLQTPLRSAPRAALVVALALVLCLALFLALAQGTAEARPARGHITVQVSALTPPADTDVRFTGRVSERLAEDRVRLQRRSQGRWHTSRSVRVGADERYTLRARPSRDRTTVFRVVGTRKPGRLVTSRTVRITPQDKPPEVTPPPAVGRLGEVQEQILAETNAYRARAGLAPLRIDPAMSAVAVAWSKDMAARQTMDHNPDYAAQIPADWSSAGENVAYGYAPSEVTTAWYDSPGHRANLLGDYTDIGIGWALDADGRAYYTQDFGSY